MKNSLKMVSANRCADCGANLDLVGRVHRCVPRPKELASQRGNVPDNNHALTGNRGTSKKRGRPKLGETRDKPWIAAGMSKATYYRRQAEERSK